MIRLTVFLILISAYSGFAQKKDNDIKILYAKDGFFHFKISEKLNGASIEIFDQSHKMISRQVMDCKKMLIDFYSAKTGTYYIEIFTTEIHKHFEYTIIEDSKTKDELASESEIPSISFHRNSP